MPELRKNLNDSETRFENYLKMMSNNGEFRKQKKAIEKIHNYDQMELKKILKEKNSSITSEMFIDFQKRLDFNVSYKELNFAEPNSKYSPLVIPVVPNRSSIRIL